jgi:hypothetical protein
MENFKNVLVIIGGIGLIFWGLFHIAFWPMLDWTNQLAQLSEINSNVMQMLNIAVIVMFLSFGCIFLFCRKGITSTGLGTAVLFFFALFWLARLVGEFVFHGGSIMFGLVLFSCMLLYLIPALIKTE